MLQGDYVEKWYVKLLTVTSIKAVKCILPLFFILPRIFNFIYFKNENYNFIYQVVTSLLLDVFFFLR